MAEYNNTYDAVISIANSLMAEGKYDSTYSAVLAIYQSLTADDTTKFDSTYSIVTSIANGLEDGSISIGGGDISLTTLTEAITKNGEYSYTAESGTAYKKVNISVNVPAVQPIAPTHKFYDLNGELVEEWTLEETQSKTELPTLANIPMDGWTLNFDGWNWDLDKIKSATCSQNIGALYKPSDNKTHITVNVTEENLNCVLYFNNEFTSVDWGDGVTTVPTSGQYPEHTYSTAGTYDIALTSTSLYPQYGISDLSSVVAYGFPALYYGNQITAIYVSTKLDSLLFSLMKNLKHISLINGDYSFANINTANFNGCNSLEHLTLPNGMISFVSYWKLRNLKTISIPYGITLFDNYAFDDYSNLQSVNIPDSVTSVGAYVFNNCRLLQSIEIPDSITTTGSYLFNSCSSLESVRLSNNLTNLTGHTFTGCYSLKSINIPDSVTGINDNEFSACYSLESIVLPPNITYLGRYIFESCRNLKSVVYKSAQLSTIGGYTFRYCSALESVTFPENLKNIGAETFNGCTSLTSINFPSTLTGIANYAFKDCYSLKSITLPNTQTSIGTDLFKQCYSLSYIKVPSAVDTVQQGAFINVDNITVDFSDSTAVPTLRSTAAFTSTAVILVPSSLYDEWIAATNWSAISSQIVAV